ncbi:hypothetical protein WJX73_002036 [Symbiochloris irregularis]|uniref:Mitochondrial fission process protein 1 n=1 Tax=Symbiochloris irregularis TaxID=706552 RepID=A0AAW1NVY7_9CHLO
MLLRALPSSHIAPTASARRQQNSRSQTWQIRAQSSKTTEQAKAPEAFAAPEKRADCEEVYPAFESEAGDGQSLFPKRQPGSFPSVRPKTHVAKGLSAISDSLPGELRIDLGAPLESGAEFDPLRDGPLRYLGYANECGEAFAAWLPIWGVPFSYAVAVSYVLVDTYDKGHLAFLQAGIELSDSVKEVDVPRLTRLLSFERALDTVVWQLLASVICPGYTIHTVVAIVHYALGLLEGNDAVKQSLLQAAAVVHQDPSLVQTLLDKSIPTGCGLAAIPFIVHPIDNAIHALMNRSLRPAMRNYVCGNGRGNLANLQMCNEECDVSNESTH